MQCIGSVLIPPPWFLNEFFSPKYEYFVSNRTLVSISFSTLQIFIVILLCKSIKIIGVIYNLMIENFFCKFHRWNPGIAKQLSKSSKNKSRCWPELLSVCNRFWYECEIEFICNNLLKLWILIFRNTLYKAKNQGQNHLWTKLV